MKNKITIIGAGHVGSTTAYSIIASDITEEIAMIDLNKNLVKAQVMDLQHSVPFWGYTKVKVGSYRDVRDSKIVIITCGVGQKPGETRLDLIQKNAAIMRGIVPQVFKNNPRAILLMVTNPVDILTNLAVSMYPKKKKQILGSGTVLDSARFRFLLGQFLDINPKSVHAYIVGEHGDSELPLWSTARAGNMKLTDFKELTADVKKDLFEQAKNAAYAIIAGKQATYYAIGAGVNEIVRTIMYNKRTILPVSHLHEGEFGLRNVCLSTPAVVGNNGVERSLNFSISAQEKKQLQQSSAELKKYFKKII